MTRCDEDRKIESFLDEARERGESDDYLSGALDVLAEIEAFEEQKWERLAVTYGPTQYVIEISARRGGKLWSDFVGSLRLSPVVTPMQH